MSGAEGVLPDLWGCKDTFPFCVLARAVGGHACFWVSCSPNCTEAPLCLLPSLFLLMKRSCLITLRPCIKGGLVLRRERVCPQRYHSESFASNPKAEICLHQPFLKECYIKNQFINNWARARKVHKHQSLLNNLPPIIHYGGVL